MMNLHSRRSLSAALAVAAAAMVPLAAFAQDASMMDNASNFIGGLVIWLLPIGGLFAVGVAVAMDKSVQSSRATRR